jgi:hypothetical protein
MKTNKIPVTRFSGVRSTKPTEVTTLNTILDEIKNGTYEGKIHRCREDLSKKQYLPVFTPTGEFSYRSIAGLEVYNGIICLDIDNQKDPDDLIRRCKNIPWVTSAFVTPSGFGVKVLIQTNCTQEQYKETELEIAQVFEEITGAKRDNHCKDIARIQFVSHDPNLFINENAEVFETPCLI